MTFKSIALAVTSLGFVSCTTLDSESDTMKTENSKSKKIGLVDGNFAQCNAKPNCVVSDTKKNSEQFVEPLAIENSVKKNSETLMNDLKKVLNSYSNAIVITSTGYYIHAEFKSSVFGFVDDVEFYFSSAEKSERGESRVIHVKSASRVGYSDLGANRKRVEMIRQDFSKL